MKTKFIIFLKELRRSLWTKEVVIPSPEKDSQPLVFKVKNLAHGESVVRVIENTTFPITKVHVRTIWRWSKTALATWKRFGKNEKFISVVPERI